MVNISNVNLVRHILQPYYQLEEKQNCQETDRFSLHSLRLFRGNMPRAVRRVRVPVWRINTLFQLWSASQLTVSSHSTYTFLCHKYSFITSWADCIASHRCYLNSCFRLVVFISSFILYSPFPLFALTLVITITCYLIFMLYAQMASQNFLSQVIHSNERRDPLRAMGFHSYGFTLHDILQ